MSTERFNKASRDGNISILKEATRKDLNQKDEDGMTPTLYASFEGQLDALRLIVGRGGDPDRADNFGNSALHFASARGHLHCVTFLVNFGVNLWALDIDYHTPKDLAAINNKEEILKFLDQAIGKEEAKDKRKVKALKEKAQKDAEKRVKEFDKLQKKATKSVEEEQRKLMKKREKMEKKGGMIGAPIIDMTAQQPILLQQHPQHHSALSFLSLRKSTEPRAAHNSGHTFSELVSSTHSTAKVKSGSGLHTGVYKKVQQRKTLNSAKAGSDFKVGDVTDTGKRSVRSLSGLRRDNEVMYVPKYEITASNVGKRGKITGLFETDPETGEERRRLSHRSSLGGGGSEPEDEIDEENPNRLTRSLSQPDYIHQAGLHSSGAGSQYNEESSSSTMTGTGGVSMFERPGFGSVAFRKSNVNSTLSGFASFSNPHPHSRHHHNNNGNGNGNGHSRMESVLLEEEDDNDLHRGSIGSTSSIDRTSTSKGGHWDGASGDEDDLGSLEVFLAAAHLMDYAHVFIQEKIDLEALMLLTDEDFKEMGIELGPRRKLLNAIEQRHAALENPGSVIDSRL